MSIKKNVLASSPDTIFQRDEVRQIAVKPGGDLLTGSGIHVLLLQNLAVPGSLYPSFSNLQKGVKWFSALGFGVAEGMR